MTRKPSQSRRDKVCLDCGREYPALGSSKYCLDCRVLRMEGKGKKQ